MVFIECKEGVKIFLLELKIAVTKNFFEQSSKFRKPLLKHSILCIALSNLSPETRTKTTVNTFLGVFHYFEKPVTGRSYRIKKMAAFVTLAEGTTTHFCY